jgi:large subunit ribosomal protein L30
MDKKPDTIRIRWIRSTIACPAKQKKVIAGLGFHRLQEVIVRPDTPSIRGMIAKVPHLVAVVE